MNSASASRWGATQKRFESRLRSGNEMALAGVVLGLIAALGLTYMATMFGVSTTDLLTFALIGLVAD